MVNFSALALILGDFYTEQKTGEKWKHKKKRNEEIKAHYLLLLFNYSPKNMMPKSLIIAMTDITLLLLKVLI